jgi:hypothetical protein
MDDVRICDFCLWIDLGSSATYSIGSSTASALDRDETVIRVVAEHDIAFVHQASTVVMNSVPYGN